MSDKMALGGRLKGWAKQGSGDDSPATGDLMPRTQGSVRQGRRDGRPGPFCTSIHHA
ncbi:hypothetical protein BJ1_gp40 [Halorubrum virus BJ1]|uniref:Uncharacterized protein n=1 Tax=Halorubrum virus BJ1 TaxID=416419 RepID=A0ZYQ3_9CAUD|nr:hypothetical protein BJ1_gp40 [Halorubrum virus BJ1]CAL92462.1 hypothetical protein [Halorubrum virus BJ1]